MRFTPRGFFFLWRAVDKENKTEMGKKSCFDSWIMKVFLSIEGVK
jgi:hypothetical protein